MALSQLRFTKRRQARHGEEDVDEAACSGSGRLVVNYGDGVKHLEEGVTCAENQPCTCGKRACTNAFSPSKLIDVCDTPAAMRSICWYMEISLDLRLRYTSIATVRRGWIMRPSE